MLRHALRGSTALFGIALLVAPMAAQAQDDSGFLGTLFLTLGKRDLAVESNSPVTVVDAEEIEDRQASTVAQLIDSVPGVTLVNGDTPQGSGVNIRGFGANTTYGTDQKIAIQIDGASVGSEELYRIGTQLFTDPFLYRRVEVLRGTIGSFEYGSGIVGGVVKLETKNASDFTGGEAGFRVAQTLQGASNGNSIVSSTTLAWQPNIRTEFLANYTWRKQEDLKDGSGKIIGNSAFQTPSGLIKGKVRFGQDDAHSVTFSYNKTIADDKDVPYDQFQTTGGAFGNVDRKTDTTQASLQYRFNPAGNDFVDLSATLTYADQKIDYSYVPGSSFLEGTRSFPFLLNTVNANQRYETTKFVLKNTAKFETGAFSHNARFGLEMMRKKRADSVPSAPGGTDNRLALFFVDEMTAGGFSITPALRWESSKVESASTFGSFENSGMMGGLALRYSWDSGASVFASASYTENMPIIDDLGARPANIKRMNTKEKAKTFEIGASYAGKGVFTPGDNFSILANFFQTELSDITSYSDFVVRRANLDRVEMRGFELEASYGLENGLYFDLNGFVSNGREFSVSGADRRWRNTPAKSAALTIGKKWDDRFDLSWEVVHNWDLRDSSRGVIDDFTVHNLRATYRPQSGMFEDTEIRFGVTNALNHDYTRNLASPTRKAPGRSILLTISKVF